MSWGEASRLLWPQTVLGGLVFAGFAASGWTATLWALPLAGGLLTAIPLCVLTADTFWPLAARTAIAAVPEEISACGWRAVSAHHESTLALLAQPKLIEGRPAMLTRRSLLAASAAAPILPALRAEAATPKDVLVMGKTIDDMIALDPAQAYEFSDNEFDGNIYRKLVMPDRRPVRPSSATLRRSSRSAVTALPLPSTCAPTRSSTPASR